MYLPTHHVYVLRNFKLTKKVSIVIYWNSLIGKQLTTDFHCKLRGYCEIYYFFD